MIFSPGDSSSVRFCSTPKLAVIFRTITAAPPNPQARQCRSVRRAGAFSFPPRSPRSRYAAASGAETVRRGCPPRRAARDRAAGTVSSENVSAKKSRSSACRRYARSGAARLSPVRMILYTSSAVSFGSAARIAARASAPGSTRSFSYRRAAVGDEARLSPFRRQYRSAKFHFRRTRQSRAPPGSPARHKSSFRRGAGRSPDGYARARHIACRFARAPPPSPGSTASRRGPGSACSTRSCVTPSSAGA